MTHESNQYSTSDASESAAQQGFRHNLESAQGNFVAQFSPDPVKSWAGNLPAGLPGGQSSSEAINGVSPGSRNDYQNRLHDFTYSNIPDDKRQDNHAIVASLLKTHKVLESKLFATTVNDKEKKINLTYGDGVVLLGGAAVVAANSFTGNGIAEVFVGAVAAVGAFESAVHKPTPLQVDRAAASGVELDEIINKVVAELEVVGFTNGSASTRESVLNDTRRWLNQNKTGTTHLALNKKSDTVGLSRKRAVVDQLFEDLDPARTEPLDLDAERMWVAQSFLLIELDAYTEKNLKAARRKRGMARAAIGLAGGILAWGTLSYVIVDEPPRQSDDESVNIENQMEGDDGSVDGKIDGSNDEIND